MNELHNMIRTKKLTNIIVFGLFRTHISGGILQFLFFISVIEYFVNKKQYYVMKVSKIYLQHNNTVLQQRYNNRLFSL